MEKAGIITPAFPIRKIPRKHITIHHILAAQLLCNHCCGSFRPLSFLLGLCQCAQISQFFFWLHKHHIRNTRFCKAAEYRETDGTLLRGIEPPACCLGGSCSIHWATTASSYNRLAGIWTPKNSFGDYHVASYITSLWQEQENLSL